MAHKQKWPRQTLFDLYIERDRTKWYWRGAAMFSALMIMIGFLVFPSSFANNSNLSVDQNTAGIAAVILLALGYTLSVALWFLCSSWLFQLDVVFLPCLSTCAFGLFNVTYNLNIREESIPRWTSSSLSALALATISTLIYTVLALLTFRKIHMVRSNDPLRRQTSDTESINLLPDEMQRQNFERLLMQPDPGRQVSPQASQSTFHIEFPRRSTTTHLSAPRNVYDICSRNLPAPQDLAAYPATSIPVPNLPPSNPPVHILHDPSLDEPLDPHLAHMERALSRGADGGYDLGVPAIVNTHYLNEKAEEAYGPGAGLLTMRGERHPLERERPRYHMVTEEEQEERRRSASRESRRAEIEMSGRSSERSRAEMEGVEVVPRIVRVETDGWGRRGR